MNSFERFRNRNSRRVDTQGSVNTHFISKGYNSTTLVSALDEDVTTLASVVSQQEKDKAYIYTPIDFPLSCGSVWGAKGLHWLVAEEIITIKDVKWHKYLSYLCNINIDNVWGYFKGPEKNYVNIKNEYGASLESLQKPVLVLPENVLGFKDKIVIKQRPWLVQEWDAISSPGLIYYSLRATTVSKEVAEANKDKDVYIEHVVEEIQPLPIIPEQKTGVPEREYRIAPEVDVTLSTEGGYFKSNIKVNVKKHTSDTIIFSIPFGVSQVEISTKEGGTIVTETFVVE